MPVDPAARNVAAPHTPDAVGGGRCVVAVAGRGVGGWRTAHAARPTGGRSSSSRRHRRRRNVVASRPIRSTWRRSTSHKPRRAQGMNERTSRGQASFANCYFIRSRAQCQARRELRRVRRHSLRRRHVEQHVRLAARPPADDLRLVAVAERAQRARRRQIPGTRRAALRHLVAAGGAALDPLGEVRVGAELQQRALGSRSRCRRGTATRARTRGRPTRRTRRRRRRTSSSSRRSSRSGTRRPGCTARRRCRPRRADPSSAPRRGRSARPPAASAMAPARRNRSRPCRRLRREDESARTTHVEPRVDSSACMTICVRATASVRTLPVAPLAAGGVATSCTVCAGADQVRPRRRSC